MVCVWTLPWRSSCNTLRCQQATLLDVPKALFGGQLGGGIPRSPGQILRQHALRTQPLQQQTRCFSSQKLSWAKKCTPSITAQSWFNARYKSSRASLPKRPLRSKQSKVKLPKSGSPQARIPENSKDVDPSEGVRFRAEDLSEKEVTSIFGPYIDKVEGNRILRVLHGQRLSGTLDQGLAVPLATAYVQSLVASGLIWLRAHYPVDEDAATMARIEREQAEEERELLDDATRLGILRQQSTDKSRLYGPSGLDAIREHYESQPVAEPKSEAEEKGIEIGKLEAVRENRELSARTARRKYWSERAIIYPGEEIPKFTLWQRLVPSAVVTFVIVGLCLLFAQNYVPPPRSARLWPEMPPAAATVISLILANSVILVLWRFPPAWRFLNMHFLSTPVYPSAMSILGNVFSHQQVKHFLANMVVLWFIGTKLHDDVGRGNFLAIYLCSGVLGSFASLSYCVLRSGFHVSSLGASGAMAGVVGAWCIINSDKRFSFIFLPPEFLPAFSWSVILSALIIVELVGASRGWRRLDHWAHLGGYATGIAGGQWLKSKQKEKKQLEAQRRQNLGILDRIKEGRL